MQGKEITMVDKKSGQEFSVEVGSCMLSGKDYGINIGYYWQSQGGPSAILISEAAMKRFCNNASVDNIIADCEPDAEPSASAKIKALVKANSSVLALEVKSELVSGFQSSMLVMNVLGAGISIVLILIGILNFINVMLTGVYIRRGELAVMESVGMTKSR